MKLTPERKRCAHPILMPPPYMATKFVPIYERCEVCEGGYVAAYERRDGAMKTRGDDHDGGRAR